MKKIIFTQEWIMMHPYTKPSDVDIYYTNLANKIYHALDSACLVHQFHDPQDAKQVALCIAAYFEDVISGTHIWKTFTTECKARYGVYIPFYLEGTAVEKGFVHEGEGDCPQYDQDEINISDIKFLLWHHYQQSLIGREIVPALFSTLDVAAKMAYDVINAEYETAPENTRLHEFLCTLPTSEDDFFVYRNALEWFHYGCYFNVNNRKRLIAGMQWLANTGQYNELSAYNMRVEQMMESRTNLLAMTSMEWLAKINENNPAHKLWTETEYRARRAYSVEREDEKYIYAKDLYNKESIKISKESTEITDFTPFINGEKIFITNLCRFGSTWWQCGIVQAVDNDKEAQKHIREERDILNHKPTLKDYKMLKDSGYGAQFVFADTLAEAKEFLVSIGYDRIKDVKFPSNIDRGVIIFGTPYTGLSLSVNIAHCICSPDNPYYDAEKAAENCFDIICGRGNAFPYEIVCQLIAGNLLPDANMFASKYIREIGRSITQENLQFLADYYLCGNRDKDISPVELW